MGSSLALLQEKAEQLSLRRQSELIDFAEFLLSKERIGESAHDWAKEPDGEPPTRGRKFDWCAGLDEPPVSLNLVESQHATAPSHVTDRLPVRESPGQRHKPRFDWVIDENTEPEPLTSVELQHLATQWMVEKLEQKLARP